MCGLFGWHVKEPSSNVRKVAKWLAVFNAARGEDSWGVYGETSPTPRRGLGSTRGISRKTMNKLTYQRWAIGHTRRATTGSITLENAHPFDMGTIVGAHNGIVFNHQALNVRYARNFSVDSMHLFAHLQTRRSLSDIYGFGAIAFARRDKRGVFLGTFNGGSLSIAKAPGVGTFWSSEKDHLANALEELDAPYYFVPTRDGDCYRVDSNGVWDTKILLDVEKTFVAPAELYHTGYGFRTYRHDRRASRRNRYRGQFGYEVSY